MHKKFLIGSIFLFTLSIGLLFWELDNVDLEANEDIYIADSVGYVRKDPFLVPRHHLRKPHAPASPHPFFVQLLTAEIFKIFGLSLFSSRILSALTTFLTVFVIVFLTKAIFRQSTLGLLAGFVYITLPLIVRYGRMAVLDPVLSFLHALAMFLFWQVLTSRFRYRYLFSLLLGVTLALSISTKLIGIFILLPVVILYIWFLLKLKDIYFLKSFCLVSVSALLVFVLFNDPYSYYYGWTNFSDPKHVNISISAIFRGLVAFNYWQQFILALLSIPVFILLLISLVRYRNPFKNTKRLFIGVWLFATLPYLIINPLHITGLSNEWAYMPLLVPLSIVIAKTFFAISKTILPRLFLKHTYIVFLIYLVLVLPTVLQYGLRFARFPLPNYATGRNVLRGDLAVTRIISEINKEKQESLVLVMLKGVDLPLWLLKNNLKTEPRYHKLSEYDYIVTDNQNMLREALEAGFRVQQKEKNPSESEVYLLTSHK